MRRFREDEFQEAVQVLKNDGVISVPTDTVYGVCAQVSSKQAEENLRNVKNRPATKAFPVMCANLSQIEEIAEVSLKAKTIIQAFMPGPITVILNRKKGVSLSIDDLDTVAIRMATSTVLEKIIANLGRPIFMTSANQSGQPTCTSLDEIEKACPLLDGMLEGEVSFGQASTIVDCSKDEIAILRQGPISLEEIQDKLK
ncbi:MAG: threonylcarbamoyl-AMP synthase [Erysipelotrichaceae bacterium]|nr:threonylcarbamoyl-AMP synthase [Erysipelotrichaceae bacterium]MDY6035587.1 L-threonylcarbamoyladenylate synthase [Bulleidia sp.]